MVGRGPGRTSRRGLLQQAVLGGTGLALGTLLGGCRNDRGGQGPGQPLRAAFSSAGLSSRWNQLGQQAAMHWGKLLQVDVHWFDGEGDGEKQRQKIEAILDEPWHFCALEARQTGLLEEPVRRLKARGVPVISLGTRLAERDRLRDVGVWTQIGPDQVSMAEIGAQYLLERIDGRGKVIHIGGDGADTSAQDREKGFKNVLSQYPEVEVVGGGVHWCNWNPQRAHDTFQTLLGQTEEPVAGAFFHSDEMALASLPALTGTRHESMVVAALGGQEPGLTAVRDGKLAATVVSPTCLIHAWSVIIGQAIVRNREAIDDVPLQIIAPTPLAARESGGLDALFYLADPARALF